MVNSEDFHTDISYASVSYCPCLLCRSIRKRISVFKKKRLKNGKAEARIKIALIKLAIFIEISFYIRGLLSKEKYLNNIYKQLVSMKMSVKEWEIIWKTFTMEDWLQYFRIDS